MHIGKGRMRSKIKFPQKHEKLARNKSLIGSAKTEPVRFKWGFGEGLWKDKFAFVDAYKSLYLRGENCLSNAHYYKRKGPRLKRPLNWTG